MSNYKTYTVIGIMSGTSMDGVDFSLIKTDGNNYTNIIFEKNYEYPENYVKKLKKLIKYLPKTKKSQLLYAKKNEKFITDKFIHYIKKFIKNIKPKSNKIDLIGISGQTIFHNPNKKYSIQLASGKEIYKEIKIPIIANFRQNDLLHGGQGAPIGSFYHKSILDKIYKKACIINLGGIANITFENKKKLISYDIGPGNALIDDLCNYYYKKKFDRNGLLGKKGMLIKNIFYKFFEDIYFKKKYPKSLDRNHFILFFYELTKHKANDAIHTASMMTVYSIIKELNLIREKIELVILTGGGRKNLFIKENIIKKLKLKKIIIKDIENYGFNGDMIEAQMFAYLAVRSIKKLPLSLPTTTGVKKPKTGGVKYGKLIKN